jgi:hypothetical protein
MLGKIFEYKIFYIGYYAHSKKGHKYGPDSITLNVKLYSTSFVRC